VSSPSHVAVDHADFFLRGVDQEFVRGQPRAALGHGERLVDVGYSSPVSCSSPLVRLGRQGLEQRGPAAEAILPEVTPPAAGHWQNLAALVPIG